MTGDEFAAEEVTGARGEKDRAGRGSRDDDREDDIVDPGAESLELKLVLLWGLSGFWTKDDDEEAATALSGGITPKGRPAVATARSAEPGLKFDLIIYKCCN